MSKILSLSTLLFTLIAAAPLTASAAKECSGFNPDKLIAATSRACTKLEGGKRFDCDPDKMARTGADIKEWLGIWNDVANNGGATIGPRTISWNATQSGRILAPGDRTWVSEMPASGGASIRVRYKGGKAAVVISYCSVDADGAVTLLGMQNAHNTSPAALTFSPEEIDGKHLIVRIDGKKPWARTYEYSISFKPTGKQLRSHTSR